MKGKPSDPDHFILDEEEKSLLLLALGSWMGSAASSMPSMRETIKRTQSISDKLGLGLAIVEPPAANPSGSKS